MFLFMAFGATNIANLPGANPTTLIDTGNLMFIALAFGLSLIVNVWIFFRVSGGLFNPAVTLALALAQVISPLRAVLLSLSQILGGITAAALIQCLIPGPLRVSTRLGGGISISQGKRTWSSLIVGLFLEMFVTALLILMIFMLAVEKTKSTFVAPVGIGLTLFVGHLAAVYWTGAGLNPARSFGPEVVIGNFPGYHWIYCINRRGKRLMLGVGPSLGAVVSTGLYMTLKVLKYDDVDKAADRDDTPLREAARRAAHEDLQVHAEPGSLTEEHAAASEAMADNV
jgi:aquaporin rerated protein, other eukaryote